MTKKRLVPSWDELKKSNLVSYNPLRQEETISIVYAKTIFQRIVEISSLYKFKNFVDTKISLNKEEYTSALVQQPIFEEERDISLDPIIAEYLKTISQKK